MHLRWLVLACAVVCGWQGRAAACSVILPKQQSIECGASKGAAHTSLAHARLQLDGVEIQRSRYAPPGLGDCGELGSTTLRFSLAGAGSWPEDVGVRLTLRAGTFNYFQPEGNLLQSAEGWLVLPQAGAVRLFGPDDPHAPLALLLEARAVDCSGTASAPIEVRVSHPGRMPDAGATWARPASGAIGTDGSSGAAATAQPAPAPAAHGSCALRSPGTASGGFGFGGLLACLALRRRRR